MTKSLHWIIALVVMIAALAVDTAAFSTTQALAATGDSFLTDPRTWVVIGAFGAALSTGVLTLADWAKRLDPDGKTPDIVELLSQSNEILDDMLWREGNLPTGHRTTVRTGLPAVAWRLLNSGITPSKSKTAQIDEQCGMLEAWSEVDKDLATLNGNVGSFRMSEAKAFIEAMNQEMASTLFYGNAGLDPEEFTGLAARYSSLSAANGTNIINMQGSDMADNTSIWLVGWGEETISGIFPSGSKAGLIHEDKGEQTVYFGTGLGASRMVALQERWQWKAGIALKDWRYVVRIANIDVSNLSGMSPADLIDAMEWAAEIIPNRLGKPVFYMNRTVKRYLRKQLRTDVSNGGGLNYDNVTGRHVSMFGDIPVKTVDALLNTEAPVT